MLKDYYKDFGITKVPQNILKQQELYNLFKHPKKDVGFAMPRFQSFEPNLIHQADLLFLPYDNKYRYSLVVIDNFSKKVAAEPLKSKKGEEVRDAFKKIYSKGVLEQPRKIEVDAGSEFKGAVKKYFDNQKVDIRTALPGRHRQQALVERANQTIGTALMKRMTAQEILTGEPAGHWVSDLPIIVDAMNKRSAISAKKKKPEPTQPIAEKDSKDLLEIGTKVRVALDQPKDVTNGKILHGRFRAGDTKFAMKVRIIRQILIKPGFPPMYLLDGSSGPDNDFQPVSYTRNQLQVVPSDEKSPDLSVLRGDPQGKVAEKIIGKKKEGGKFLYEVQLKGYKDTLWVPKEKMQRELPIMLEEYEKAINK